MMMTTGDSISSGDRSGLVTFFSFCRSTAVESDTVCTLNACSLQFEYGLLVNCE